METVHAELSSLLMHDAFVRSVARGIVDAASVDDVVQDTWWTAARRPAVFARALRPWLGKVARNLALNARRAEARRHVREVLAARPEAIPSTTSLLEREAVRRSVVESVFDLSEPLRSTIVLRYFEGLAPREIARRMSVPVETVRSRLKRAFSILRDRLAPVDHDARKRFGVALLAIAHGPRLPVAAAAAGKTALLGALAMSTGTKIAATIAALLLVVGLVLIPPYVASRDRDGAGVRAGPAPSDAPAPVPQPGTPSPIRAQPYAEGEAPSSAPGVANALEIEVIGPARKPASHARLLLHRGAQVLAQAITNAEGLAALPADEGEAGLIVLPDGAPLHFTTIAAAPGRRRVELPAGQSITGRVEIDGAPPSERLALTMSPAVEEPRLQRFREALRYATSATCTVGSSGEFEFAGLREGSEWQIGPTWASARWEWRIGSSSGYRVTEITADGRPAIVLAAPATGVVVKLRKVPVVRGRVVSGDRRLSVARAHLTVLMHTPGNDCMSGLIAQDDGTFSFPVEDQNPHTGKVERIKVEVVSPTGIGRREFVLDPAPERDHDLGDVELPPGRTIRYVVRDPGGKPIEGAFARARYETDPASRTNAEGQGSILVDADVRSVRVGALKHEVVEVAIPSPLPELLPVVLEPNAGVEIRVLTNPAAAASFTKVRMTAEVGDVVGKDVVGNDAIYVSGGATPNRGGFKSSDVASFDFVPVDGRVVVAGLQPGIPFKVTALDGLGNELATGVATVAAAEWKTVDLQVSKPARILRGRVLDASRKPVPDARAMINADPEELGARDLRGRSARRSDARSYLQITATTDEAGRFALNGVFDNPVHFAVDKPGFVPWIRRDFALPADDAEVEVVLPSGCELSVKVVDAQDVPIRGLERFLASVAGYPTLVPAEKQPGEYVFADFPADVTATVEFQWAEREWSRTIAVKGDHVERVKMPAAGTLVIDYSALERGDADPPLDLVIEWKGDRPGGFSRWVHPPPTGAPRVYEVAPLLPGEYTATLYLDRYEVGRERQSVSETVRITAGETTRIVFRKP